MVIGTVISGAPWSGNPQVSFVSIVTLAVTGTAVLQLPINCVVIGDQPEEKKIRFVTDFAGVLKKIFRE